MNIVLIVLDTARGDMTNTLIQKGDLPNLAKLATDGHFYLDARANGPWTVPSHAAMFTGEYPSDTGINGNDPTYGSVPLVNELKERGYTTGGFSANPWLSHEFEFTRPFDAFFNQFDYYPDGISCSTLFGSNGPKDLLESYLSEISDKPIARSAYNTAFFAYQRLFRQDSGGSYLLSRAADWLSSSTRRFAFVNVTEPHLAYDLPSKWLPEGITQADLDNIEQNTALYNAGVSTVSEEEFEVLRRTYESTLKYIDSRIGQLVDQAGDETVFIVAGDHGEHFGEYGRFGHQYSLHRELLHVPLVVHGPPVSSETIEETVELRSLYQYIIDLADEIENTDRLPDCQYHIAETVSPTPSIESLDERSSTEPPEYVHRYAGGARCITDGGVKLVEFPNGETEIVDERDNSDSIDEDRREALYATLIDIRGKMDFGSQVGVEISQGVKSRLDDLGYV